MPGDDDERDRDDADTALPPVPTLIGQRKCQHQTQGHHGRRPEHRLIHRRFKGDAAHHG